MSDPLTPIERKVYHYLLDFLSEHSYQPSVREIGKRLRIPSTKTVAELLQALEDKGYVEREPGRSRGVKIVGVSGIGGVQPVPLYARVNAVQPYLTSENRERFVQMDRALLPTDDVYFLRVVGNDMAHRSVLDGDWALVSPSTRAHDGDLVASRIGPHVSVRVVAHLGAVLSLSTGVPGEKESFLGPTDDFAVLGVVVGVVRGIRR
ncbi:MAG: transcriptional repressor LexA [Gemmatimonadaceae bacterium]